MITKHFFIAEYDPNPLLTLGKRRRRNSGASCESHSKDRRTSAEATATTSNNNNSKKDTSIQKEVCSLPSLLL